MSEINLESVNFTVQREDGERLILRGTQYLPNDFSPEKTYPVVVLLHGFGGNRIDYSGFMVQLARMYASVGVMAITYDRAGHGESDGSFFDTTVTGDVADALQVIAQVRQLPGCDPDNLHLAGLSLGAVIATFCAPQVQAQPKSITLFSIAASYADEIRGGTLQGQPLHVMDEQGYFDFMGVAMGGAMVDDAVSTDPYKRAQGFEGKVKIIHGSHDFIPISYAEKYREVYGDSMNFLKITDGNHGFGNVKHREMAFQAAREFIAEQIKS